MGSIVNFVKFVSTVLLFGIIGYGGVYIIQNYVLGDGRPPISTTPFSPSNGEATSDVRHFENEKSINADKPFAMLLLGVDEKDVKTGRTDSIIVAVVNPGKEKVSMLSIPRDLRVQITGRTYMDKINAAYAYGGIDMTASTISTLFDIPIEHYAVLNFNGFIEMVDTIGGINVDVEKDIYFHDRITKKGFMLDKGPQKLDGIQALNYARFRSDGEGDFGRMRRQQQVISELIDQSITLRNAPKLISVLDVIGDNVTANISMKDMAKLGLKMRGVGRDDIETIPFSSSPTMISGVSYVQTTDAEIERIQTELKALLEE